MTKDGFTFLWLNQELPCEEVREDLVENGQNEEILQKKCPPEYSELTEEEVSRTPVFQQS